MSFLYDEQKESIFEGRQLDENESKKRWPEKSAGRAVGLVGGSFDFSRSFGYFSIMGKVTQIQFERKPAANSTHHCIIADNH